MFVFRNLQASDLLNAMSEGGGPWKSLGRRTNLIVIMLDSINKLYVRERDNFYHFHAYKLDFFVRKQTYP